MSSPGEALCTLSNRRPEIEPLDNKIGARSRAALGIATFIAVAAPQTAPSRGAGVKDNVRPLIARNWKMNGLTAQLGEIEAIAASVTAKAPLADVLICTPATLIARAVHCFSDETLLGRLSVVCVIVASPVDSSLRRREFSLLRLLRIERIAGLEPNQPPRTRPYS